jgi:hypothetical protein
VDALARVLEVSRAEVLRAMHETRPERSPWEPPDEAELLNLRQRRVLEELIRTMVEVDREKAGAVGDSSRRASLTSLSPAVSTAQISLTKALTVVVYDPAVLDLVGPPGRALREELLAAVCGNGDGDELAGRRASLGQRHRLAG